MAKQQYEIQNKRMLVVAAILALVVVVLWNLHVHQIRQENEEDMVSVYELTKDLHTGEAVLPENLRTTRISARLVPVGNEDLGNVVLATDSVAGLHVTEDVAAGRILKWSYLEAGQSAKGESIVPPTGFRLMPIGVDSDTCPPDLAVGDYVDLWASRPSGKGQPDVVRVMERVLVKSINGAGRSGTSSRKVDAVGVEVDEQDAAEGLIRLQMAKVRFILLKRNPDEKATNPRFNNDALKGLVLGASTPRTTVTDE